MNYCFGSKLFKISFFFFFLPSDREKRFERGGGFSSHRGGGGSGGYMGDENPSPREISRANSKDNWRTKTVSDNEGEWRKVEFSKSSERSERWPSKFNRHNLLWNSAQGNFLYKEDKFMHIAILSLDIHSL